MVNAQRRRHRVDATLIPLLFLRLFWFLALLLSTDAAAADNTGVSIPYCSTYLCARFPKTITAYFKAGCEGDFRTYLVSGITKTRSATVPPRSLLAIVASSIALGVIGGYVIGRRIKTKGSI